jgi:hypothetical protein
MGSVRVNSRAIAAVNYHQPAHALDIVLSTGYAYRYFGVSDALYSSLMKASSKGRFFDARIRGRFTANRLR